MRSTLLAFGLRASANFLTPLPKSATSISAPIPSANCLPLERISHVISLNSPRRCSAKAMIFFIGRALLCLSECRKPSTLSLQVFPPTFVLLHPQEEERSFPTGYTNPKGQPPQPSD